MSEQADNGSPGRTILVVTDTPEDVGVLDEQLAGTGCKLVQSWDTAQALKKVQESPPDLVLLDIATPGRRRLDFCRQLRANPETEALPVIVIGQPGGGHEEEIVAAGADGFIVRPFQRVELLSRVRTLLRMKELHDKVAEQNRQLLEVNARLDRLNQELVRRNRELEQGMVMARRLQEALLPQQYPAVKGIGFSHAYIPADTIGGDVFQFVGLSETRAAVFIADVSGHGVRAALITSIVKTVVDYIDFSDKTPTQVLQDFNSRFRGVLGPLTPQLYATAVLMVFDGEQRKLWAANAGHPRPLLVSKRHMSAAPVMSSDDCGPALGFLSSPDYPTAERDLEAGDIVLGFTDGVYEVLDEKGRMYGLRRLRKLVGENAHLVPRDLIQRIMTETEEFMGTSKRPDDVCIVATELE